MSRSFIGLPSTMLSTLRWRSCSSCSPLAGAGAAIRAASTDSSAANVVKSLQQGLKEAMRAKNKQRAQVLKSALADIQSLQHHEKPPSEIQTLLQCVSKRKEALEIYSSQGREDLVQQFKDEIAVLDEYIPEEAKEMSLEDLSKMVEEAIKELGVEGDSKGLSKVIKHVRTRAGLRASSLGKDMAEMAKKALSPSS